MKQEDFWYIVAEGHELKKNQVISRSILGEWLAVFRDSTGKISALQDKCLHRTAQISRGKVTDGKLQCPYHGWTYNQAGEVTAIPSMGDSFKSGSKCAKTYEVIEQEDYIYVRLANGSPQTRPFSMPCHK